MVELDVDSKNVSVAGQAQDMCLKLVSPEYDHKPWDRDKEFLLFLEQRQLSSKLFFYKDSRNWVSLQGGSSHKTPLWPSDTSLVNDNYTTYTTLEYHVVSDKLFSSVKKTFTEEFLNFVSDMASEHLDKGKKLIVLMQPQLKTAMAIGYYGIDEETFPMDYPVSEQVFNIDTLVQNIGVERQCGKVDYRPKKLGILKTVSRSIILLKSKELRDGHIPFFIGFKIVAQPKERLNSTEVHS